MHCDRALEGSSLGATTNDWAPSMSWQLSSWTELQSQPALVAPLFSSSLSFPPTDVAPSRPLWSVF